MKKLFLVLFIVLVTQNVFAGEWVQNGSAWMYKGDDGIFYEDEQKQINGKWYYFGSDKCLLTGFQKIGKEFYHFNDDGTPCPGTLNANNKTFNVNERGRIVGITEAEFETLTTNNFAVNVSDANKQFGNYNEIIKKYMYQYPLSKRMLKIILQKEIGNFTTDKIDTAMNKAGIDSKEMAVKCAKEYYRIKNELCIDDLRRSELKRILKNYELFTENEANHGVDVAYDELKVDDTKFNTLDDERILLEETYDAEMLYKVYGTQEYATKVNNLKSKKKYNTLAVSDDEKKDRRNKSATNLAKIWCRKMYWLSDRTLFKMLKNYGYFDDEAKYAVNNCSVSWLEQAIKYGKFLKLNDNEIKEEDLAGGIQARGFTEAVAKAAAAQIFNNSAVVNIEIFSDEAIVADLVASGFSEKKARELLKEAKDTSTDVLEVQKQETKSIASSGNYVTAGSNINESVTKATERILQLQAEGSYSKEQVINKINVELGIDIKDINKALDKCNISWIDEAYKIIEKLVSSGTTSEFAITDELTNAKFTPTEISFAIERAKTNNLIK